VAQEVAQLARNLLGPTVDVYWFGSWPKGEARPGSDIDVALVGQHPLPLETIALLREAIDNLPTLLSVDLVDVSSVSPRLRKEVLEMGVKL